MAAMTPLKNPLIIAFTCSWVRPVSADIIAVRDFLVSDIRPPDECCIFEAGNNYTLGEEVFCQKCAEVKQAPNLSKELISISIIHFNKWSMIVKIIQIIIAFITRLYR